jgi:hypothetical protein
MCHQNKAYQKEFSLLFIIKIVIQKKLKKAKIEIDKYLLSHLPNFSLVGIGYTL